MAYLPATRKQTKRLPAADGQQLRRLDKQHQANIKAREMRQPRQQYSIEGIKQGLDLDDNTYREFYTIVERIITKKGWINNTFRTISGKETAHVEITKLVLADHEAYTRAPTTISCIKTPKGQAAFGCLVYKICSNFRRRNRRQPSLRCAPSYDINSSNARHSSETAAGDAAGSPPLRLRASKSPTVRDSWQDMVSVVKKDGRIQALCRLCELDRGWPDTVSCDGPSIDDLDFERFIEILEGDHAFRRSLDCLAWEKEPLCPSDQHWVVDNERQWRAIVAHMLKQGRALTFIVKAGVDAKQP